MVAANLSVPPIGAFVFLTASSLNGWPIDQVSASEEELRSPGVDGRRWRTESQQQAIIQMQTVIDLATYDAAIVLARSYRRSKGLVGTLTATIAGTGHIYPKVHIADVMPRVMPGGVFGSGALAGSGGWIICDWNLIVITLDATAAN